MTPPDYTALARLIQFARLEQASGDIEPWAAVVGQLHAGGHLDREQAIWLTTLYNTYDDLSSAWQIMRLWPDPAHPLPATVRDIAPTLPISRERRNLYGGRILTRMVSYTARLAGGTQHQWITSGLPVDADPHTAFDALTTYLRRVWGVGRLAAFEWAEHLAKVVAVPVHAGHGQLWESSGPRTSLQRLYHQPAPTRQWVETMAGTCRKMLSDNGVELPWWDFETVICDFNVMRSGRYYPGKHIAMIRHEIESLDGADRQLLRDALHAVIPEPWCRVPPGTDRKLQQAYRRTGVITLPAPVTLAFSPARRLP